MHPMASLLQLHRQRPKGSGPTGWSELPPQLLERISSLLLPLDRVAIRLVCSAWRLAARTAFPAHLPFEPPRLLLRRRCGLAFFSLSRREFLPFTLPSRLSAGRCCGHLAGWLAMAFDNDHGISLSKPIANSEVTLPPAPVGHVAKVVLSAPPTSPSWVAAAMGRSGTIALCSPATTSGAWVMVNGGAQAGGFKDMAFWRGRLCSLGYDGTLAVFRVDLRSRLAAVSVVRPPVAVVPPAASRLDKERYLVESEGELLLVARHYNGRGDGVRLDVFRLDGNKWAQLDGLGDRALFIGAVRSEAVPLAWHSSSGLGENCVYYTRNVEMRMPHVIGMYSMEDGDSCAVPISGEHSVEVEPVWISPFI